MSNMSTLINPPQNVITGANAAQASTLVTDLSQIQNDMIRTIGGLNTPRQGKVFNNTWTATYNIVNYPTTAATEDSTTLDYQINLQLITTPEDFFINLPLRFVFERNPGKNGLADWPTPKNSQANQWLGLISPSMPILELFKSVSLKLGANNLAIMAQNTSNNDLKDFGAMKSKQYLKTYIQEINDDIKLQLGLPFGNCYDSSDSITSRVNKSRCDTHLRAKWDDKISSLYELAFIQNKYDSSNYIPSPDGKQQDKLLVDVSWPIQMSALHEFFDNAAWLMIGFQFRLDIGIYNIAKQIAYSPTTNNSISVQFAPTTYNKHYISFLGRQAKTEYIRALNNELVLNPTVYLCDRVEYSQVDCTAGNGCFQGQFLSTEQLPRCIVIQLYWRDDKSVPNFKFINIPNQNDKRSDTIYNLPGNPLAGFVVTDLSVTQTNGRIINIENDFPSLQSIENFKTGRNIIDYKYFNEMQEKVNIFEVPMVQDNWGDYTKPLTIRLNMDPTYDASLGNTTLLNGNTTADIKLSLACIDQTFNDWKNLFIRVYKYTDYQVQYDSVNRVSVIQFPASAGASQTPIIPAQTSQPQV